MVLAKVKFVGKLVFSKILFFSFFLFFFFFFFENLINSLNDFGNTKVIALEEMLILHF